MPSEETFYVTKCPPGRAEGADSWDTYTCYGSKLPKESEPEIDLSMDEDGNPRPLDWFFNDN